MLDVEAYMSQVCGPVHWTCYFDTMKITLFAKFLGSARSFTMKEDQAESRSETQIIELNNIA